MKISKVVVIVNRTKGHAKQTGAALKTVLDRERVQQQWVETLPPQRNLYRRLADLRNLKADLVIASVVMVRCCKPLIDSGVPVSRF